MAEINDGDSHRSPPCFMNGKVRTKRDANAGSKYSEYLEGALGHLTRKERAVLEPVLRKYRHVFHDDEATEFNPLPALTYQSVLDLNAACRSKRTEAYWLFSS